MAFSTWAVLKTAILDDIANGSILTKSYSIANRTRTFKDMADVVIFLKYIDEMILAESMSTRLGPTVRGATPT
jgi:hypothetical protein